MQDPTPFEKRWRQRFTERGAKLDNDADIAGWTRTGLDTRVRQFLKVWDKHPGEGSLWLDIGCGAGTYTRILRDREYSVFGLDYSAPSISKARDRSPADIAWLAADIHELPLPDQFADGVLCFGVMQALGESKAPLKELARVVKSGGEVWVDALNARCLPTRLSEWHRKRRGSLPHLRYETVVAMSEAAEKAGFRVCGVEWLTILPGRLHRFQPVVESSPVQWLIKSIPFLGACVSHSFILRVRRK